MSKPDPSSLRHDPFSDQTVREAIGVIPAALFIKDRDSKIVFMNLACEEQWGIAFADLQGTDGSQFFPPEQTKLFLAKDQEVFAGGQPIDLDEQIWNAELKANRTVHTVKKPLFDEHGNATYLIGMMFDITDRKQAEEMFQHQALHDALKNKAAELEELYAKVKPGRYNSLAVTSLEQSVMWIVKGLTS